MTSSTDHWPSGGWGRLFAGLVATFFGLFLCYLWACLAIDHFHRVEAPNGLWDSPRAPYYQEWGEGAQLLTGLGWVIICTIATGMWLVRPPVASIWVCLLFIPLNLIAFALFWGALEMQGFEKGLLP
jgi:hypothetical protein